MKSINFNTGIWREYAINGDENNTIRVNIADPNLFKRMEEVSKQARAIFDRLKADHSPQTLAEADTELRGVLDHVFGVGFSDKVFGMSSIFTPVGDGDTFLIAAFLEAFGAVLGEDADSYRAAHTKPAPRPEVAKYLPRETPLATLAQPYSSGIPDVSGLTAEQKKALLAQLLA